MSFPDQAAEVLALARARHPGNQDVQDAADRVAEAFDAGIYGDDCPRWGAADPRGLAPDWALRAQYALLCGGWEDGVRAALSVLELELERAGDAAAAEVVDALSDQAATMGEQAADVADLSASTWWENAPIGLRIVGVLLAARLAWKVIR